MWQPCYENWLNKTRVYFVDLFHQIEIALSNIQLGPMVVGVQKLMFHTLNVLRLIIQKNKVSIWYSLTYARSKYTTKRLRFIDLRTAQVYWDAFFGG